MIVDTKTIEVSPKKTRVQSYVYVCSPFSYLTTLLKHQYPLEFEVLTSEMSSSLSNVHHLGRIFRNQVTIFKLHSINNLYG